MAKEIERKFLVKNDSYKESAQKNLIKQGYISTDIDKIVRVRISGEKAYLTIKGKNIGITRSEFEYEIQIDDAENMLENICQKPIVEKIRYKLEYEGHTWEIDEFFGDNEGLKLAEIELKSEDEAFKKPEWLGIEVSDDVRYYNANLIKSPYKEWGHTF